MSDIRITVKGEIMMVSENRKTAGRLLSGLLAILIIACMLPLSLIVYSAPDDPEYDYLEAKNVSTTFYADNDRLFVSWKAFSGNIDTLTVKLGTFEYAVTPVTKTNYTFLAADVKTLAGDTTLEITATCGTHSRTYSTVVVMPHTLVSLGDVAVTNVANDLELEAIINSMPNEITMHTAGGDFSGSINWDSTTAVGYNKDSTDAQSFTVTGTAVCPSEVTNRNKISMTVTGTVNSAAAENVAITTNISENESKYVDESLEMSVEATGTAVAYQWYKNGAVITGETASTYTVSNLALSDNGNTYYCLVTGKTGTAVTSNTLTLAVNKRDVNLTFSVTPENQTRPNAVTLSVSGLPNDATGTYKFSYGTGDDKVIDTVDVSTTSVSFNAIGSTDNYNFYLYYSGDNTKYNDAAKEITNYSFQKGSQTAQFTGTIPSNKTFGDDPFTVSAEGSQTNLTVKYEYSIDSETDVYGNPATPGTVASVNGSTGEVTINAAGQFRIAVKALSDDDYNESPVVYTDYITVARAAQASFAFAAGESETVYVHNFSYTRAIDATNNGSGTGAVTYALGTDNSDNVAQGVAVNETTGEITFTDNANDNSADFNGKVGTVTVVATKAADGCYNSATAQYTITVTKANQATFEFSETEPAAITYTANSGTTYTNAISAANNGSVTVNNNPVYSIFAESALPGDEITVANNVASIDAANGKITANRSGVVTVKAELAGNGVYNPTEATYTVTVNRGTVATLANGTEATTGFRFAMADSSIKYGYEGFCNIARGGQSDTTPEVTYSVDSEEVRVEATSGAVAFKKNAAQAATEEYSVVITATKPQTDKYEACSISYTLTVTRDAVDATKDFLVNGAVIKDGTLTESSEGWYNEQHANIVITPAGDYAQISEDGATWQANITREAEDKYSIAFYLRKNDGTTTLISNNQAINFDKTRPEATVTVVNDNNVWDAFVRIITFGLWKNTSKELKVEATDNLSGIKSIEYYEQNSSFTDYADTDDINAILAGAGIAWQTSADGTIAVNLPELTNKKVVVFVKVTDYAGNITYLRSDGMVFDNISPTAEIALSNEPIIKIQLNNSTDETGLYNDDVPFRLTVVDPDTDASGIKNIKVTISKKDGDSTVVAKEINVTAKGSEIYNFDSDSIDAGEFTVANNNTFIVPKEIDSNYITIAVEVEDFAGNKTDNSANLTRLAIDISKPVINVKYTASNGDEDVDFSNGNYIGNNQNRKAKITITELNFDSSAVVIDITKDGNKIDVAPVFAEKGTDNNGDNVTWEAEIDFASLGEGVYTFDIDYTDVANNGCEVNYESENAQEFIIDNTKPLISVEITNSDVLNGKYFAADREATVTVVERFFDKDYLFDWSGLTYSIDGVAGTAPTPVLVSSDDKTFIRVYRINFTAEGDYTFDVKYTDLADNLSDAYSCSSVSYKEFTIDKTAPVIEITGVADKSANKGDIAPVITYSDINFNKNEVKIQLSGTNNGVVNYAAEYADIPHGQTYTYANFEKKQTVDDIYTLSVKLTDMAGNSAEKVITFSANRFGSVYSIEEIKDILNKYLQKEVDIVFTETNVDALRRDTVKIVLNKNGTPSDLTEGTDYTVTATGGNGQWSRYRYTIDKSLFATDGRYSISVYSVDAAGNVNENIDETKKAEISFGIDKTKPVVIPVDFESNHQYAVNVKTVSVEIKDNLVLEGVKIYLNDTEVKYKVDGETYTFDIPEKTSTQEVRIVAVDAAGNENVIAVEKFLVSTNIFARWFNNTPLFVGSLIGVGVLAIGGAALIVFGRKRKS